MAVPAVPRSALLKQTHHGLTGGLNRVNAIHELPEGMAWNLYDAILDNPGVIRQRGPVAALGSNSAAGTDTPTALFICTQPGGTTDLLFGIGGLATPTLRYHGNGAPVTISTLASFGGPAATNPLIVPAIGGGVLIGSVGSAGATNEAIYHFRGATKAAYATGTMSTTRGSVTVTGVGTSWLANVSPGMFLMSTNYDTLYGVVKSVTNDTTIVLEEAAGYTAAGVAYNLAPIRGLCPRIAKGRITCGTGAATVTGGLTKFTLMQTGGGLNWGATNWDLYRASDLTWIGKVSSVTNDRSLTLGANAAVAMSNERYIAVLSGVANAYAPNGNAMWHLGANPSVGPPWGALPSAYANRQFYACADVEQKRSQVWFSDPIHFEAVDVAAADGDWFRAVAQGRNGTWITAIVGTQNALLIFKPDELWALTGDDASNFVLQKIADSGTWSSGSIQQWRGTTIFASREGILQFDGVRLKNISAELGDFWRSNNQTNNTPMGSMLIRNHYVLWAAGMSGGATVRKGNVATTETQPCIVINLETGAITLFSNCRFRGAVQLSPAYEISAQRGDVAFAVDQGASGYLVSSAQSLWTSGTALDTANCGATLGQGPNFYVETRAYDLGDPERTKYWKDAVFSYFANGEPISLDYVLGIGTTATGTTAADTLAASGTMTRKRVRLMQHGQTHLRLRIYPTAGGLLQNINIGTFSLRGRPQRFNRTQ